MGFIESYKHLEKICGDMFESQHGVSSYIEKMLNNPRGSFLVKGWENDLKKLKHYRWIRNQIVHEPDCSEETMCEIGDDEWLDDFYERIINRTDPLAKYIQAIKPRPVVKSVQDHQPAQPQDTYSEGSNQQEDKSKKVIKWIVFSIIMAVVILYLALK